MKQIEVIARVLVVKEGRVLTCKAVQDGHYFLPGGHVEFGESASAAIVREMREEAAVTAVNLTPIGLFENTFGAGEELHHEINVLYAGAVEEEQVISVEPHIAFEWVPVAEFGNIPFLPEAFRAELIRFFSAEEENPIFLSTL
jgi:8-oxo-dGTP pyrophosphatase MutT (NUDIX family)